MRKLDALPKLLKIVYPKKPFLNKKKMKSFIMILKPLKRIIVVCFIYILYVMPPVIK